MLNENQFTGVMKAQPKKWVSEESLQARLEDHAKRFGEDAPVSKELSDDAKQNMLEQPKIMSQIRQNAFVWHKAEHTPEGKAALDHTVSLIAPFGGNEAHARALHMGAIQEHREDNQRADGQAEDAAGINGIEGLHRAGNLEHYLNTTFGRA